MFTADEIVVLGKHLRNSVRTVGRKLSLWKDTINHSALDQKNLFARLEFESDITAAIHAFLAADCIEIELPDQGGMRDAHAREKIFHKVVQYNILGARCEQLARQTFIRKRGGKVPIVQR